MPELLYLSRQDVERLSLPMAEVIDCVALALKEKAYGRTEMPPKPGVHPRPGALLHAMPAWVERARACGMKWVSAFPNNKPRGLPSVGGLIVLNDPETGFPEAVLDGTWITAMRTGAATAVAARELARRNARTLGVLGAGVQARTNLAALKQVLPELKAVRVYGPHQETAELYKREMEREHGIEVRPVGTPEEAVKGSDLVVTAAVWPRANGLAPIQRDWIAPGVFACALDFDSSFDATAVADFQKRFTDDVPTFEFYQGKGYFPNWPGAEELATVIAGMAPGRRTADEPILVTILGLGIYDVVVALRLLER